MFMVQIWNLHYDNFFYFFLKSPCPHVCKPYMPQTDVCAQKDVPFKSSI